MQISPLQGPNIQSHLAVKAVADCRCPGWKVRKVSPKEQGVCLLCGIQKPSGLSKQGAIIPTIIPTANWDEKGSLMPSTVHVGNCTIKAANKTKPYLHPKGNKASNLLRAVRIKFSKGNGKSPAGSGLPLGGNHFTHSKCSLRLRLLAPSGNNWVLFVQWQKNGVWSWRRFKDVIKSIS